MRNNNNGYRLYQNKNALSPSKYNDGVNYMNSNSNNYNIHVNNMNSGMNIVSNNIRHNHGHTINISNNNNNNINHNININNHHSSMRDSHHHGILSGSQGVINNSEMNHNSHHEENRIYDEFSWYELDMRGCGIRSLSPEIRNYGFLTAIYLSTNRLTSLPEDIFSEMKSLLVLDLSFNSITRIPTGVTQLITLEKLYLQNNRIVELPLEMGRLYRLKDLNVTENPILSPPQSILQGSTEYVIAYLRDRMPMPPPPPERRFISYLADGKNKRNSSRP